VLGEFFAARADEVDDGLVEHGPLGRYETVEAKTVSSVSIATLGEILGVGAYDDLVEAASSGPQAPHGESGIDPVPGEITAALARATDLDSVVAAWATTDEMVDWDRGLVRNVVRELAALATKAQAAERELWFWWSV
jgi:hypothetical protein